MQGNGSETVPFGLDEERLRESLGRAQNFLERTDRQVRKLAAEQPLVALGGALVAGYLVGRILARR